MRNAGRRSGKWKTWFIGPPATRFGPPRASDLREYLLHDTVPGRLRDWPQILLRSLVLLRAVRRRRAQLEVRPLLHGGQEFLDELAACTHLLRVSPPGPGLRERWLEEVTLRAARRLGVVTVVQGPRELGLHDG